MAEIYKVKVFISWSGKDSRSHIVAKGLRDWIEKVIQLTSPFMSSDDIFPGERWNGVLNKELDSSGFGILCLTRKCLSSPWILFEAGVLAGGYGSSRRVCPFLIDLPPNELNPPINQFNAVVADKDGTYRMMQSLNQTSSGQLIPEEILRASFNVWWDELETILEKAKGIEE
ncbi:MAG: toll/interleukin-1 receptor domain-containing protein [Cyanobacteria bacterium J06621_8]